MFHRNVGALRLLQVATGEAGDDESAAARYTTWRYCLVREAHQETALPGSSYRYNAPQNCQTVSGWTFSAPAECGSQISHNPYIPSPVRWIQVACKTKSCRFQAD